MWKNKAATSTELNSISSLFQEIKKKKIYVIHKNHHISQTIKKKNIIPVTNTIIWSFYHSKSTLKPMHTKHTLSRESSRVITGGISPKGPIVPGPRVVTNRRLMGLTLFP